MARDITKLHPELQDKIKKLQDLCAKNGLKIGISECVRTVAEQDALYAKGRTAPGNKVTNAKGSTYSSMHMWGVAFDFYRNDGKGAYENKDGFFQKVGKLGKSIGLEWGGDWKSIVDLPHFQLPQWGSTTSKLKSLYGTPDKFMKTWKKESGKLYDGNFPKLPERGYFKSGDEGTDVKRVQKFLKWYGKYDIIVNGKYDSTTIRYVKKYQSNEGLVSDGEFGKKSLERAKIVRK